MKICFVVQNLNTTDGGGRFSHDLISNLKSRGIEVTILTGEGGQLSLFNFFKIRKIFKNSNIIHAIDIWPNGFYARFISIGLKKPIVITALGTFSVAPLYSWRRLFAAWTFKKSHVVAISNYTKEKINEIISDLNIKVITPGFNLDFWSGTGNQEWDREFLKYKPYILSVGALKPRKGYINSIRAFDIVSKKFENFTRLNFNSKNFGGLNYVIVGQGEDSDYAKELKKIVKGNNLEKKVFFISSGIDDNKLLGFYKNAELFVLTPIDENHHFEGFGIVYLEAAASGLPIVATYNSGATSATKENYNSILVAQNDIVSTADAILKILERPDIEMNMSKNGREWVKNFSHQKIIENYISIYENTIKHN